MALGLGACREKEQGGDWAGQKVPAQGEASSAPAPQSAPSVGPVAPAADTSDPSRLRFVAYNVENWLTIERTENGKLTSGAKPEKQRNAVTQAIVSVKPDILGVAEIGKEEDVRDLQKHLADAGWPMTYSYQNHGADPTRSLVLLSRYPIGKTVKHENLTYRLQGEEFAMQRGILDASVDTPVGTFRFIGLHLKSKRDVQEGDEEEMRRNEAHLLRRELDAILSQDPQARLVVYGDFNDTRNSPSIRTVQGSGRDPSTLNMLPLRDSRGEYWTHHWDFQDVYSRIDYVMVSQALKESVDREKSRVVDGKEVSGGSDHRPLLVILKK
ncbi:endonuclease/exonuclease/phosphatase family protein [Haloferula sp. BvORR071]|uniref:endonuclease/exonuclease/phosphatase family protein n=1 Tax=Haloferula sp. BvORR071 TaxID=1396141 RepID=UPI002240E8AB|nr:endonuclease/exonuclease/phosphatase family protein [Haloferula sp. BvORR071]